MEYTAPPAAPRGIFRRLFPWTLSLGLFAGGGYGVYAYALPKKADLAAKQTAAETKSSATSSASSSSAAKEQIKQLFGTTPSATTPAENRYAQAAPIQAPPLPAQEARDEVSTPRSADAVVPQNPF